MNPSIDQLDITQPGFFVRDDYYDSLAWLRHNHPAYELPDGIWLISTYEEIREVSRQPARYSSRQGALINDPMRLIGPDDDAGSLLHLDPPRHADYRKLLNRRFTPRAVAHLGDLVRTKTNEVLADVAPGEDIDGVERIAIPIPVAVIAELLGVGGGDQNEFRRWSDAAIEFTDNPTPEILQATGELFDFFGSQVRDRRQRPTEDLISMLVRAEVGGRGLSDDEVVMFCFTLLVAGNETTRSLISGGLQALAEHPAQRAMIIDEPDLLPNAMEECLRWVTPIQAFCRTTTEPVELAGASIPAGAYLVLLYGSGNRDETAFGATADRFDVTRPASPAHVAFGFGEHLCLGASLARLEARVVFNEVLRRFPNYGISGTPTIGRSTLTRSLTRLPLNLGA